MSCERHQEEIDKASKRRKIEDQIRSFEDLRCPFCGAKDLFVLSPGTLHWSGVRRWWTVGCDSRRCNSCWHLDGDSYEMVMSKILFAQGPSAAPKEAEK